MSLWTGSEVFFYLGRVIQLPHPAEVHVGGDLLEQSGTVLVVVLASPSTAFGPLCLGEDEHNFCISSGSGTKTPPLRQELSLGWDRPTCDHPTSMRR